MLMHFTMHRSILVSIRALSGDTFYALPCLGFRFTTHSQKKSRRYGPKKLPRGGTMSLCRLGLLIFHLFCNAIPYGQVHFSTLQRGLWKRFCVRVAVQIQKKQLFSKKNVDFFVFCVRWEFVMDTSTQASIWSPFGRRFSAP